MPVHETRVYALRLTSGLAIMVSRRLAPSRRGALLSPRFGEQVRLALAANAVLHFLRVVSALGIAAAVRQADTFERLFDSACEGLDFRPEVVAAGQVEAYRPATAAAVVAIPFAEGVHALLLLFAPIFPRGHIFGEKSAAHGIRIAGEAYRPVAKQGRAATVRPMADLTPVIETMEHSWMRAWVNRDAKALKALTSKDFILLAGSKPPTILDRPSWLEAATKDRWDCSSYRFGDIYVRNVGGLAVFAAPVDLKATMDGQNWSGQMFVTDLWRKGRVRRSWKLVQRVISKPDDRADLSKAIRALQLWK